VCSILSRGLKREAPENIVSPVPAKRKNTDVIVIDPFPSSKQQQKPLQNEADQKRIKELESRVKTLESELSEAKNKRKSETDKLLVDLQEKSALMIKRNKEVEAKKEEVQSKGNELREKTRQLKILRGNVCKLLQVLVPEIDVESEGDGETVDDLLKQVLDANK
jgi:predicted RNase H-like nuclease (RuvC/YqgF family)